MALHRLLGLRAAVPDPASVAAYYGELGLTGDADRGWSGSEGGAVVELEESAFRRPLGVTVGCADAADLDAIVGRLGDGGADVARTADALAVTDPASRVRFEVRVAEPWTDPVAVTSPEHNAPGHTVRTDVRAPAVFQGPRPPRRLGHLVLGTPDFAATRDLLIEGLGFRMSDEIPGIIGFYRCSPDHHNLALVESPVPLLQHYSWMCDDVDHVGHTATALLRADPDRHAWGFGRHFAGSNFYWYLRDPAGSFVELYSDLDQILDDEAWEVRGRTPFEFEHLANSWGPEIPLEFIVPTDLDELQAGWAALDA